MKNNIPPPHSCTHPGREALALPKVHRFIWTPDGGERVQYRMARRCDPDGAQWLWKDLMYDEHRYRTRETGEKHGIVAACIFPNGHAYIFKLLAGEMPERHMHVYERRNRCRVDKALRKKWRGRHWSEVCTIIVMYVGTRDRYGDVETALIKLFKASGLPLYNDAPGYGTPGGWYHSSKARKKMRQAALTRKPVSAETRAKQSRAHKGRKKSPEAIEKTRQAHLGSKRGPETRAKMRKPKSPEHRAKLSLAAKRWRANRERPFKHTPKTRAKVSRSLKQYWARIREEEHADA